MLINIKKSRASFAKNVFNKSISKKYGINTPYCEDNIIEGKLIGDLLYYYDDAGANSVDKIDVNNLLKGVTINYNVYQTGGQTNHYTHVQSTMAATWLVTHNLGFNPVVAVYDSTGNLVETSIQIDIPNVSLRILLNQAITGIAECSI
jgi:hypothetical protein